MNYTTLKKPFSLALYESRSDSFCPFHTTVHPAVFHPESVGRLPRVGVPGDRALAGPPHAHRSHVIRLLHHTHQVGTRQYTNTCTAWYYLY